MAYKHGLQDAPAPASKAVASSVICYKSIRKRLFKLAVQYCPKIPETGQLKNIFHRSGRLAYVIVDL